MKILISGDWHIRATRPRRRVDNYVGTQADKVRFLLDTAQDGQCKYIIQPGDLTEHYPHPRCPYSITQWYIREFLNFNIVNDWQYGQILTIPGQHDMVNHNDLLDTPMMTMESAQVVQLLEGQYPIEDISNNGMHFYIYGHTYGTPVPEPRDPGAFNILVTHQMVSDRDYWNGTVRFSSAYQVMHRLHYYNVIICGDNHNHFSLYDQRTHQQLFNCGSLMRATIAQRDHKPVAYIFDIDTREATLVEVPIQPADEVFSPDPEDPVVSARREGVDMVPFVERLRAGRHGIDSMNYVETLWRVAETRRINDQVRLMIQEDLRNAYNETPRPVRN